MAPPAATKRKVPAAETTYEQMYLVWLKSLTDSLAKLGLSQKEIRSRIPRGHPLGPALVAHISKDAQPNARRLANAGAVGMKQARRSSEARPSASSKNHHPMSARPAAAPASGRGVRELDEVAKMLGEFMSAVLKATLRKKKHKEHAMGLGMSLRREQP